SPIRLSVSPAWSSISTPRMVRAHKYRSWWTPVDAMGNPEFPQVFLSAIAGNGNNFFNLTTPDGEVALGVTVTSNLANIVDIRQVRIAGETIPTPIPEPGTLALLGSAMLGLGFARWRRR